MTGLPNITGRVESMGNSLTTQINIDASFTATNASAIYTTDSEGKTTGGAGLANATVTNSFNIDASLSNPIYGNSDTVTPLSLSTKFFIKY